MLLKTHKSQRKPRPIRLVCEPEWKRSPKNRELYSRSNKNENNSFKHSSASGEPASPVGPALVSAAVHAVESKNAVPWAVFGPRRLQLQECHRSVSRVTPGHF